MATTTYSFKDLKGVITMADETFILAGGNVGAGSITITMSEDRTVHDVAADGSVMPSYVAGDNGSVSIEAQQTSALHKFLLGAYNTVKSSADDGDVDAWASGVISFNTLLDGSTHQLTGVSFQRIPAKAYAAHGARVTWNLMACNIANQ